MAKNKGVPVFVKKGRQYMDVIKAIENYSYYHRITGRSWDEWNAWRVQACEEWMLDKAILEKGDSADGETDYERPGCYGGAGGF